MPGLRPLLLLLAIHLSHTTAKVSDYTPDNFVRFLTRPDIAAPRWIVDVYEPDALMQDSYWFLAPYGKLVQEDYWPWNGAHIFDMRGDLIWSGASLFNYSNMHDFRVSKIDGRDVLTFDSPIKHRGNGYIYDNTYTLERTVDMQGNRSEFNMHDFNLVENGKHAIVLLDSDFTPTHLSVDGFEGPCGIGWQGFQEIDIETNEVLFYWDSHGHVGVDETTYVPSDTKDTWKDKCATKWDITHFNAIDKFPDGDYLLSSRHTDSLFKISHKDGSIVWRLGGTKSDFVVTDERARFTRQHHARVRGQNATHIEVSLFDNAFGSGNFETKSSGYSWGLHLALRTDVEPMEVSLVHRYEKPVSQVDHDNQFYFVQARGSMDILPNGNVFMGWAVHSLISEHAPNGRLLMMARMVQLGADSYRSYKMQWKGYPAAPPDVISQVSRRMGGNLTTTVHVSWNGATEVATWHVLHTNRFGNITELVASSQRTGFETKLTIDGFAKEVIAVGIDAHGHELGRSGVIHSDIPQELKSLATTAGELEWMRTHENSWWTPEEESSENLLSRGVWFIIGLFCSVAIALVMIPVWRRRRSNKSWIKSLRLGYKNVAADEEEELADREELLYGNDAKQDREGDEEVYYPSKAAT